MNIIDFVSDPTLLGPFFEGSSWDRWRAVLRAAYALPMAPADIALFDEVANRAPPQRPVDELVALAGRGGGKDSIASAVAAYEAVNVDRRRLRPGEKATVLCLAVDRVQAEIAFGYLKGYFEEVPLLASMVERMTADTIDLTNGASIIVATNSFRAVRGRTIVCAIYDEVCFWRDDNFASPDFEVDAAISPGLARHPGAKKILISSVHKRAGLAYQRWRECFGVDDPDTLVVLGGTLHFCPHFPEKQIARDLARDFERYSAEYNSRWRDDLTGFVDRAAVEACVEPGCFERGRSSQVTYRAFCDPSGGRQDAFSIAIAHGDGAGRGILDVVREVKPPFSPDSVVAEFAELLRSYGITEVTKDNYAAEWVVERFREHGITCVLSDKVRSALYLELLPLINSGRVELLDNAVLVNQLCSLERRTARSGRDQVNHPDGGHDDLANAAAGVLVMVSIGSTNSFVLLADAAQRQEEAIRAAREQRQAEAAAAAAQSRKIEVASRMDDTETEVWIRFTKYTGVGYIANRAFPGSIQQFAWGPGIHCIPRVVWTAHEQYLRGAGAHPVNQQKDAA